MADERRVTEVTQEVEYVGNIQQVTQVTQEVEYVTSQTNVTEVTQEVDYEGFPDVTVTSDFQAVEWTGNDVVVTSDMQVTEWNRGDVVVTSVMQMVEYLDVPPPPVPPDDEEMCPPFRIFWQDSNVRCHSWKDGAQVAYHTVRAFGGPHQINGARI